MEGLLRVQGVLGQRQPVVAGCRGMLQVHAVLLAASCYLFWSHACEAVLCGSRCGSRPPAVVAGPP